MTATLWISIIVALISAISAIIAALTAARSATKVKSIELQAKRISDLESRISERKYDVYKPMIELLQEIIDPRKSASLMKDKDKFLDTISKFSTWITIYGSDDAVSKYHDYMQTVYTSSPPSQILLRIYAEFVIAARRDMGYPDTRVEIRHFLGMRINDLYTYEISPIFKLTMDELYKQYGWTPPWLSDGQGA